MSEAVEPVSRDFAPPVAMRMCIVAAIFAGVGLCNWLLLPVIQSLIIPSAPGGVNGPWVVRPILAFHYGAMAVMTAVSVPVLLMPLQRRWKAEDRAAGTSYDPFHNRPLKRIRFMVAGLLLFVVYSTGLLFYLFSWTTVGQEGIVQQLPWETRHHSFQDIVSLERIPGGMRSDALKQDGPWYNIKVRDGQHVYLTLEHEGLSADDLACLTSFIAARSGLEWERRTDVGFH